MAISPKCICCETEFDEFGAILISPPDDNGKYDKDHLCISCYNSVLQKIQTIAEESKCEKKR